MSTPFVLKLPGVSKDCSAITRSLEVLFRDNVLNRLIKSDMVATPVVDQRNTTFHLGGEHHCTTLKLTPRKGVTEQWMEQMYDLLSNLKLTKVTGEMRPPTLVEVTAMLPGVPDVLVAAVHDAALTIWWAEATRLYYVVRASIDISGIYEAKDLAHIKGALLQPTKW